MKSFEYNGYECISVYEALKKKNLKTQTHEPYYVFVVDQRVRKKKTEVEKDEEKQYSKGVNLRKKNRLNFYSFSSIDKFVLLIEFQVIHILIFIKGNVHSEKQSQIIRLRKAI